jgi:hypothetical protein
MPRFIEVQDAELYLQSEYISVGDVLFFHASGTRVLSEGGVIEVLGTYVSAVAGTEGQIVTPLGPPNVVLLRALRPGKANVCIMTGDPFGERKSTEIRVNVGE